MDLDAIIRDEGRIHDEVFAAYKADKFVNFDEDEFIKRGLPPESDVRFYGLCTDDYLAVHRGYYIRVYLPFDYDGVKEWDDCHYGELFSNDGTPIMT